MADLFAIPPLSKVSESLAPCLSLEAQVLCTATTFVDTMVGYDRSLSCDSRTCLRAMDLGFSQALCESLLHPRPDGGKP